MPRADARTVSGSVAPLRAGRGGAARFIGVAQLLDEHHLVVLGDDAADRAAFASALIEQVELIDATEVVRLPGAAIRDLRSFCAALTRGLSARTAPRSVGGVIEMLRAAPDDVRRRYVLWEDADVLLDADVRLFGRLANALLGAAAEHEHLSIDPLVLLRTVFLGGDGLGAYLEAERGQFQSWRLEDGSLPFGKVAAILPQPAVLAYRLDG